MKKTVLFVFAFSALTISCTHELALQQGISHVGDLQVKEQALAPSSQDFGTEPGVALVYFSEEIAEDLEQAVTKGSLQTKSAGLNAKVDDLGITRMERLFPNAGEYEPRTRKEGLHRWYVVDFDKQISVSAAIESLSSVDGVEWAERSLTVKESVSFNDPYWKNNQLWGVNNTRYPEYDINCEPVWDQYTTGNPNVTVAVVDGGLQLDHPDLKDNIAGSGHYNYVNGNTNILPHYHGVHVGGTIAAVNNNGIGVTGIAGGDKAKGQKGVKLLSLQVFRQNSDGSTSTARSFATAIKEGADKGALISQNSWGHNFDFNDNGRIDEGQEMEYARSAHQNPERSFTQAVDYFNKYAGCDNNGNQLKNSPMKGGVVIFAAGNDNIPYGSPGNYDGCISVGAIQQSGNRTSFSNYGDWVDICAPGQAIYSTAPSGSYQSLSGTSMACPHVSGVAALIVSYFGGDGFTADELRARLTGGAKTIDASSGTKPIGPLVDAYGSFQVKGDDRAPAPIQDYSVATVGHNIKLDFVSKDAYGYLLLASKSKSSLENVNLQQPSSDIVVATRIMGAQETEGTSVTAQLIGLTPDTDYYVSIAGFSYGRKFSALSPIKKVRTNMNKAPTVQASRSTDSFVFHHYEMVDIPFVISDPDGDDFTFTFETNGRAYLESTDGAAGIQHFKLLCPVVQAPNTFNATIIATDELGASYRYTFNYSVLANVAPAKVKDFPTVLLKAKGETAQIDLREYLQDPDGEKLDYRVASSKVSIASAKLLEDGYTLEVKAVGVGSCEISVSGSDSDGEYVQASIKVLFRDAADGAVSLDTTDFAKTGVVTIIPGEESAQMTVRIISSTGTVVYTHSGEYSAFDPLTLNLIALAPGIYTVEVVYQDSTVTYTLVKR